MRLHSYVVARDYGFAPNPFFGVCTLATCKPRIRNVAQIGDWVVGTGSKTQKREHCVVYAMRVTAAMTFDEYSVDPRFQTKKPNLRLELDRTSCPRFWANQFRVLLTAAAYALMQEIRRQARRTSLARAQVTTLREHLLKLSARIEESVRRIVVHLPRSFAYSHEWTRIARQLGAAPT